MGQLPDPGPPVSGGPPCAPGGPGREQARARGGRYASPVHRAAGLRPGLPLLFVLVGVGALPALADEGVKEARSAYQGLDYEGCAAAASKALEGPGTRDERRDAYQLLGLCRAALGDTDGARDAFVKLLGVDREARLPDGLSPRFTSSFLEAKGEWTDREPTGVAVESEELMGKTRVLRLKVNDPVGLLDEIAWRTEDGEEHDRTKVAERMELEVPVQVAKELVAFDAHGGEVAVLSLGEAAAKSAEPRLGEDPNGTTTASETDDDGSTILTSPFLWLGVGAVGAAVLVSGAVAAGVGLLLYEPRQVTMEGHVAFADDE